ncbi:hypothetical protein [Deinococcus aquaticus]|uniref:hypothetical protein n=1 Tax=Deinococcus aquaticus TaxID=328692 RepID=UPI00360C7B42
MNDFDLFDDTCPDCSGTGYDDGQCHTCGGTGSPLRPTPAPTTTGGPGWTTWTTPRSRNEGAGATNERNENKDYPDEKQKSHLGPEK